MSSAIKTTGQLREFLVGLAVGVKDGTVEPDKASRITKLAAQVNESFYSEIKIARVQREAGVEAAELGDLSIGGKESLG
jgi:hypothetical protein